jgi:hypothetical protein
MRTKSEIVFIREINKKKVEERINLLGYSFKEKVD